MDGRSGRSDAATGIEEKKVRRFRETIRALLGPNTTSDVYDAFLSYSHEIDGRLAPALQASLERFAKPWYVPRSMRVFRDQANLSASPGLWSSIEARLQASKWFVLLASPLAANSAWVRKEVLWWLQNRDSSKIIVVLTSGTVTWRDDGFDATATTALPLELHDSFIEEPHWVDMRWICDSDSIERSNPTFQNNVAEIAATIREVPKDEMIGEHLRQHRLTLRAARSAVTALAALLIVALVATFVAFNQRDEARTQALRATSNQILASGGQYCPK